MVGSIFAVRSSGQATRLWVGQSITSTGSNDFKTVNADVSGDLDVLGALSGDGSGLTTVDADTLDGKHANDFYDKTDFSSDGQSNTPVIRDGSGDIRARLFRSEYTTTNSDIGVVYTARNASNDFMRPSTPSQVKAALSIGAGDVSGLSDAATTTVSTIRAGTSKANVGLSNVRNVTSYSQTESDSRHVSLTTNQTISGAKTFSEPVNFGGSSAQGESVTFDGGVSTGLRLGNQYGYVSITPLNNGWAHIYTDRPNFIFNRPVVTIANEFRSYNNNLKLGRIGDTKLSLDATQATFADKVVAPQFVGDASGLTGTIDMGTL